MKTEILNKSPEPEKFPKLMVGKHVDKQVLMITGRNKDRSRVYEGFAVTQPCEASQFKLGEFCNDLSSENLTLFTGKVSLEND